MYILDTSALRGISRSTLEEAKRNHDLAISPLTFYELLCHLDEDGKGMSFARQRGNVMKCQVPRILYDPFAHHAIDVGAEHVTNPSRFEDPDMIAQLLKNLDSAQSLEAFYATTATYPDGQKGDCRDISARAREVLDVEQNRYVQHLGEIKRWLVKISPSCASVGIPSQEMAEYINLLLRKMAEGYKDECGIMDESLLMKVYSSIYMHIGYKLFRTVHYMRTAHDSGNTFTPNPNDCEDSYIIMHLALFSHNVLVTDDKGTLDALGDTRAAFSHFFGNRAQIESRVLSKDEFLAEI
jgi:predicted nucleic acid-binding protein